MEPEQRYIDWEMERVAPQEDGTRLVKFVGYHSESRYLQVTQEQFDHIRKYLTGQE